MPSTGTPSSSSAGSSGGAPSAYTDAGPPDRITPLGRRRRTSAAPTWWGSSSENTPDSRTRRAISWEYWPPKSRTTTSSTDWASPGCVLGRSCAEHTSLPASLPDSPLGRVTAPAASLVADTDRRRRPAGAHPDPLVALELLALRLERGSDRELGAVELGDVPVAARRHRCAQRAHQVEGAVVLTRRPLDDLLERAVLGRRDPRPARQRGMKGRHPPVVT